jgi:signal transduction histidine kinase
MLRKIRLALFAAAATMAATAFAASQFGTATEAKALLEKAVAEMKADPKAALAKFNKADGGFRDRDLYVFCYEMNTGKFTAHVNPSLLGTDIRALKQRDGAPLGERIFGATKSETVSAISYEFPKPGSNDPVPKESFVTQVSDQGCGVGYYK